MTSELNVAEVERWASALGGAALAVYGIRQRSVTGAMIAASGGALIARGATGHCPVYAVTGVNTADGEQDTRAMLGGSRGIHVETAVTIDRRADELYAFWRNFENLPRFMPHLVSVRRTGDRRSHWVAKAPAGNEHTRFGCWFEHLSDHSTSRSFLPGAGCHPPPSAL